MIAIKVNNRSVLDALQQLQQGLSDMSPVMAEVAKALASESERQFNAQRGPLGRWDDLQDVTKARRTAQGTWPGRILQVSSGGLAPSVQTSHGPDFAAIHTNKPYAAMHQFGGVTGARSMIPGKTIAARPFLPFHPVTSELTPQAERTVMGVVSAWLEQQLD